ncbi:Putative uncharacterized protein [Moritella viscosa]|uniref:Uncharacterized protein n=1 Tax=Moritella viscosa TaxID=80854 RepID=A0A1K9ZI91_9GAMM|nr:Putative uncharacterized protein [Moritella viscosa]SGY94719.1 Putative uncharacterized protein [Moritella viscosa]SGY95116.1 Putative uncharacterized protein [Moritella viscosa]SGY99514.1 Putative uncharacterized protein [Moritella viscosa]SGZ00081.1 Putative uncharacterized protein [Moritella viscosa]
MVYSHRLARNIAKLPQVAYSGSLGIVNLLISGEIVINFTA